MSRTPILVVDDAPINRKLMRLLLTHEGYEVRTAEAAEEALDMLSEYRPELILADIQLPGMNGLDMARKVKENPRTSTIRVVALTGCAMKDDRERALRAGCEDYITKPIDTATLPVKVREVLSRPALLQQPATETPGSVLNFSGPGFETLRRRFVNEGVDHSRRLLDSLNSAFDAGYARKLLHEWAGSAGLLGHPEIGDFARHGEELLRETPVNTDELRIVFTDLYFTFTDLRESKVAPLPEFIVWASTGKRIALIGFSDDWADSMCALLERVKARPRLFDADDVSDCDAIRDCDLVVLHVRPETRETGWLQPGPFRSGKNLVFLGAQSELMALLPEVRSRAVDFLIDSSEPEELLMRLSFAMSRTTPAASAAAVPAPPAASAANCVSLEPRAGIAHPDVVLADDDGIVLTLLKTTLQNYGMNCLAASNGAEALQLIRRERPHAAVLDVNMPGMDGFEVLAALRAEGITSRVVMLTSLQQEKEVLRGFHLGADDYLSKPFNPFELVARLKRLLR